MVDIWDFWVIVYNCGVGVWVRVDDNGDTYIHGKIHGCVLDWFHKVCKVCTVRMGIDWLEGPGRKWLGSSGHRQVYPSSSPLAQATWSYRYFLLHFGHTSLCFCFFLSLGTNGVGGGVGVTG